jgi:hypothetical protein
MDTGLTGGVSLIGLMLILGVNMFYIHVANMASYAISSSMILVIHDNMINGTNHII